MDNTLLEELKVKIIAALNLEEMTAADIDAEAPLFGEGLGLDSIDALELILILERDYGIKVKNTAEARPALQSVRAMADYIEAHRSK